MQPDQSESLRVSPPQSTQNAFFIFVSRDAVKNGGLETLELIMFGRQLDGSPDAAQRIGQASAFGESARKVKVCISTRRIQLNRPAQICDRALDLFLFEQGNAAP